MVVRMLPIENSEEIKVSSLIVHQRLESKGRENLNIREKAAEL